MTRTRLAGPRRLLLSGVLAVVTGLGSVAVAAAPANAQTTPRAFDAVTTQWEGGRWKHLGLKRDQYVIFDDLWVYERGVIRNKWPFLPSAFHSNLDAAAVIVEGRSWRYIFVQDNQIITFNDGGIITNRPFPPFPGSVLNDMDAVSAFYWDRVPAYMVTQGAAVYIFSGAGLSGPGRFPDNVVPFGFLSDLDDISVEQEGDGFKVSLYKGYERVIYYDALFGPDFLIERLDVRSKWPHLRPFFDATV
jgi:hypothetical protein